MVDVFACRVCGAYGDVSDIDPDVDQCIGCGSYGEFEAQSLPDGDSGGRYCDGCGVQEFGDGVETMGGYWLCTDCENSGEF